MGAESDLKNKRFGRLLVIEKTSKRSKAGGIVWHCECDCGNTRLATSVEIRNLVVASCGCYKSEISRKLGRAQFKPTHGCRNKPIYYIWHSMRERCRNPNNSHFNSYGGRGIKVCKGWRKFENFLADMGEPPAGLSLHRRNNDRDYKPSNCEWATKSVQALNRRTKKAIESFTDTELLAELRRRERSKQLAA